MGKLLRVKMGASPIILAAAGTVPEIILGLKYIWRHLVFQPCFFSFFQGTIAFQASYEIGFKTEVKACHHLEQLFFEAIVIYIGRS